MSPPEFSIICHTHGGPATTVEWLFTRLPNNVILTYEENQVIVDTSQNSVYENKLHVRGNYSGTCTCIIENNRKEYFPMGMNSVQQSISISGRKCLGHCNIIILTCYTVAGEPTNLAAESNSTHVTVSWESPGGPVTGYVIYYQPEGRYNSSVHVSGGETESHSLDCLERGLTYYIYIVALSDHLPSPLVGPVTLTHESK